MEICEDFFLKLEDLIGISVIKLLLRALIENARLNQLPNEKKEN